MGLLDLLTRGGRQSMLDVASAGIKTTWSDDGNLSSVVWAEALGEDVIKNLPLTRSEAIGIPAVSKGRNLLVSTIMKWNLRALAFNETAGTSDDVTRKHPWLYRTNGAVGPHARMAWTVDDAIFHGCSLWLTERSTEVTDGRRPILNAAWCPFDWWAIADGRFVLYPGGDRTEARPLTRGEYLFFDFPFEGLLNIANRTLRGARSIEDSWVGRSRNPIPLINLKRTEDYQLGKEEAREVVDDWAEARTGVNGAIGSTPPGIDLEVFGEVDVNLMIEGRNAVRTDVGSFLNVRTAMLDGTVGVDSLTYTTKEGERNAFFEFDVPFWTDPIEERLSMDDVVPRGTRVRFDKYQETPAPSGPETED